jgi:hypothetical protein
MTNPINAPKLEDHAKSNPGWLFLSPTTSPDPVQFFQKMEQMQQEMQEMKERYEKVELKLKAA